MSESSYPYTAKDGDCAYVSNTDVSVADFVKVVDNSVDDLVNAIALGPVSVTIEADKRCFQIYKSGVFNNVNCGTTLDHAVTAVGYGTDPVGGDYYTVRNSWGSSWGEAGYIRIARVAGAGICGIQTGSLYPIV